MIALRLAVRQWFARPLRPVLCSIAIAAAVALIVGVGAGFDSLRATLRRTQAETMGVADVFVRPFLRGMQNRMPENTLGKLRARPEVQSANGRLEAHVRLASAGESGKDRIPYAAIGIDPVTDDQAHPKTFAEGRYATAADEINLDELAAVEMKVAVGDAIAIDGMAGHVRKAKVVGIVRRSVLTPGQKPVTYLPAAALAKDIGLDAIEFNTIEVQTVARYKPEEQLAFAKTLGNDLGKSYEVKAAETRKNSLDRTSQGMDFLIVILSIVSGLCAALIIATTLSVGVQERLRVFGQLRCIGASRRQMVVIVLADAALLAFLGVALGLLVGWIGARELILHYPKIFTAYVLTGKSVLLAMANGCVATLIGAAIPAWRISRVTPMQAVSIAGQQVRTRGVWVAGGIGLGLLAAQMLMWVLAPDRDWRFWSYVTVGIPCVFAGYCLLGPAILLGVQRAAASVLGRVLFVRPALLRQAWSRTPWRAGGMIAALMIGVVMYASVRQRSEGLMASWDFPKVFPDVILISLHGASLDEVMKLKNVDGVTAVTGLGIADVPIEKRIFGSGHVLDSGKTKFAAIDAPSFRTMVELEFLQGSPKSAMDRLAKGKALLVSQEFHVARGVNLGDMLPLKTRDGTVDFEVVGVVKSTGIDMTQGFLDVQGQMHDDAVSSVLGTLEDGKKYFGVATVQIALVNMELKGRTPSQAMEQLRDKINGQNALKNSAGGLWGITFGSSAPATRNATGPGTQPADGAGGVGLLTSVFSQALNWQATSVIEIKEYLSAFVHRMVNALSAIAIAAMCVASLGVANMVIASIQARSFEFGVLRAVGTGRGQLLRMVIAEVTLVSVVAGMLGSIAGLHFTFMGTRVDRLLIGYTTPFISWQMFPRMVMHVVVGVGVTVLLGWLSAAVPAIRAAYRPQRELLAEGRC